MPATPTAAPATSSDVVPLIAPRGQTMPATPNNQPQPGRTMPATPTPTAAPAMPGDVVPLIAQRCQTMPAHAE